MRWTDFPRSLAFQTFLSCLLIAGFFASLGAQPAAAEDAPGVYVILDASGSMWGQLPEGKNKIVAAREVLADFVAQDFEGKELALRAYGHNRKGDCADTELVVPFAPAEQARGKIVSFANGVNPKGKTPITRSLRAALEDFGDRSGELILISDGLETCDADPCALMKEWRERNVAIRVHVVGLGLEEKEKEALSCIADAAGTPFYAADSTAELADGLGQIREVTSAPALILRGVDADGEELRIHGTALGADGEERAVASEGRNLIPAGEHALEVGVRTKSGEIYRPVTRKATLAPRGETLVEVEVSTPPRLSFRFEEDGEKHKGALVRVYQEGKEVFSIRPQDVAYVMPGEYELRSKVNQDNELKRTITVEDGEDQEVLFALETTVKVYFQLVASGSGIPYRHNTELWQDGERAYKVHSSNGARAVPGTYTLVLPNRLTPFQQEGVVITAEENQEFVLEVPSAHLTVNYLEADGSAGGQERIFLDRWNGERWQRDKVRRSGERFPITPGRYQLNGWNRGDYQFERQEFTVEAGDELELELRDQS